ncbi:P-type ATPase [Cavenderia fasciculata]|uniref:Phospholipid-transporting ATPase n=1 Tax=Cavenderia fasciculata TaxID=261658 RepID=F4QB29_CACFS|nr:P-type ATPase [Cavenderia fasciculata]EGG14801.1 P-type ATPase [Cavenderia fasciculata]|eukprot:XP_004351317.1 P-type ATPase [Cavenderia fasciculata]
MDHREGGGMNPPASLQGLGIDSTNTTDTLVDIDLNNNNNNNNRNTNIDVASSSEEERRRRQDTLGWILDQQSNNGSESGKSPTIMDNDNVPLPSAKSADGISQPPNNNNNNSSTSTSTTTTTTTTSSSSPPSSSSQLQQLQRMSSHNSSRSGSKSSLSDSSDGIGNNGVTTRQTSSPSFSGGKAKGTSPTGPKKSSSLRNSKPKKSAKPLKKHKKKKYVGNSRSIYINDGPQNIVSKFCDNRIKTTKYSVWSFIPKNLYEQFRRVANFYFLVIAIIQLIPGISPVNPYTTWLPLLFVLAVTAVKEGIEDWKRRQSDNKVNNLLGKVLRGQEFIEIPWKEIKVGDVVKVNKGERFPADLVILNSSEQHGVCYIETSNLDGETNLKQRQAIPQTFEFLRNEEDLSLFRGFIECEHPNNVIYVFHGAIALGTNPNDTKYPLNNSQTLLRGCVLRNTEWIYGSVVYTGEDTKIMQNSTDAPSKRSTLEKLVNRGLINLFSVMFVVCVISTIVSIVWTNQNKVDAWYLGFNDKSTQDAAKNFLTFMITFAVMIPISLYVSLELVKVAQAVFISWDLDMYHAESDTPARSRTSNLSEELGQIEYIFSDKTGTLTRNQMDFLKCSVGRMSYGSYSLAQNSGTNNYDSVDSLKLGDGKGSYSGSINKVPDFMSEPLPGADPNFGFRDRRLLDHLNEAGSEQSELIHQLLTLLSVCHSVIPDRPNRDDSVIVYEASSPDEAALVTAAKNLGYAFYNREPSAVLVNQRGQIVRYEFLNILEFNSDRKRMSVIVRDPKGRIVIYTKGADTTVLPLLRKDMIDIQAVTLEFLQDFAAEGLRTLCCAYAYIEEDAYVKWNELYKEAAVAIQDRDAKVDKVAELIERDLCLIGSTAIEDKLQVGVPQAIANLAKANIKLWVLTGDKQETAINIGFSCHLLTSDMKIIILNGKTVEEVEEQINGANDAYFSDNPVEFPNNGFALVVEGSCLNFALEGSLKDNFLDLASSCKSVICCRTTPLQKAQVVKVVRDQLRAVTLAIGDGANDVSMIQAAHIGVGISGNEGMQAVMASDYSIAQFRFLYKLVVAHGRWDYKRNSRLILYCFYKNMVFAMTQFWFGLFNAFSAQTIYDSLSIAVFNVIFTGLPIIVYAILDQDVSAQSSMQYPQLYKSGQKDSEFNLKVLWVWLVEGWSHSVVIFFMAYGIYSYGANVLSNGQTLDIWAMGQTIFILVVITVNLKLALETRYWTWLTHFSIWGSILIWFLWQAILASIQAAGASATGEVYQIAYHLWASPLFWLGLFCIPIICLVPDSLYKIIQRDFFPYPYQIVQELERVNGKPDQIAWAEKGMNGAQGMEQFKVVDMKQKKARGKLPFLTWIKSNKVSKNNTGYAFTHGNEVANTNLQL